MTRRRLALAGGVAAAALLLLAAWWPGEAAHDAVALAAAPEGPAAAPLPAASAVPRAASPTADERQAQRALWAQRLQRARFTLDSYRQATRYPHESRPIAEHPDQVHPNRPIVEERPLRNPGGAVVEGLNLRTTQERVFAQGDEGVLLTVAAVDAEGRRLPLEVPRAFAHEGATGVRASRVPPVTVRFTDDGRGGDARAGDGVLSFRLHPASQGFAQLDGVIRVELALQSGDHPGYAFFDVIYSPEVPATWGVGVREVVENGSLNLYLPVQVLRPGRYVASGRIDDARGKPFALATFNDELAAGPGELRLQVFGKLLRDGQPAFPLVLRDVEAFLLKPDAFPDRALLPRRAGTVHTTAAYALGLFSDAEWRSEERQRYLDEYTKDVREAEDALDRLGPGP